MYYAYVLQSLMTNKFYYGSTQDLEKRLEVHNVGLVNYTSKFMPWIMVYSEVF
jgi:putative endonuclease